MIQRIRGHRLAAALAATVLSVSACSGVGSALEDVAGGDLGALGGSTYSGEVRSVDTRRGRLQIREEYDGRTATIRYDDRTRVVYGNREYPVSTLERGDYVRVRVDHDGDGTLWAERIEVTRNGRDDRNDRDNGVSGRTVRLDGRVRQIDVRRYIFTVEDDDDMYLVYVPSRASRDDVRRFERLRRGDRARADVRIVRRGQAELIRFR